jgi:hypothetical protein
MQEMLEDQELEKTKDTNPRLLIGIGVFLFLAISGVTFTANMIIKDALIYFGVPPIFNFWITESIIILIVFASIIAAAKKSKSIELLNQKKSIIFLRWIIIIFICSQVIQAFYASFQFKIWPDSYIYQREIYYNMLKDRPFIRLAGNLINYLNFVIIGVVLLRKINTACY